MTFRLLSECHRGQLAHFTAHLIELWLFINHTLEPSLSARPLLKCPANKVELIELTSGGDVRNGHFRTTQELVLG